MAGQLVYDYANRYLDHGWAVMPIVPGTKLPATMHGVKDASKDDEQIAAWFKHTEAGIGIACGRPSGFFVVDIDPRNGGDETWEQIVAGRELPETARVATGGGGTHILFAMPDFEVKNGSIGEGVDIKSTGGYIVAAPTMHESGNLYQWVDDDYLEPAPGWLLALLPRKRDDVVVVDGGLGYDDPDDDRPGAVFNRTASWAEILEPAGWSLFEVGADGEARWTRPGKSGGISATTGWEGRDILYVFTSSTEFEAMTGYSKFAAYTILNHGGDFSAAGKELAGTVGAKPMPGLFTWGEGPAQVSEYTWEAALPEDHLLSRYVEWCHLQTDAAREYHEAAGLVLLSMVTSKCLGKLTTFPAGLHSNLYVLLTGPSTTARKSTAQKLALQLVRPVYGAGVLPAKSTTEALIQELADKSRMATVWTPDELGIKLGEIYQRDFLRGLEEMLLTLYDCEDYSYVKMSEKVNIESPHLSVLGAATPESLAMAGPGAMLGGLLPRFAIVFPDAVPPARPVGEYVDLSAQKAGLIEEFKGLLAWSSGNTEVTFSGDALEVLADAEARLHVSGVAVARLATMLYKVGMLVALGRRSTVVELQDAVASARIVARWEKGARNLQPYLRRKPADLEFESYAENAFRVLKGFGAGEHHRSKVARELKLQKSRIDAIQAALVDWSYIEVKVTSEGQFWKVNV